MKIDENKKSQWHWLKKYSQYVNYVENAKATKKNGKNV